jgi:hypothetical protein
MDFNFLESERSEVERSEMQEPEVVDEEVSGGARAF